MKNIVGLIIIATFALGEIAYSQRPVYNPSIVEPASSPAAGVCTAQIPLQVFGGVLYSCQAGVWTSVGGSGTFNALSGDATSTATGGATTVVGLNNVILSTLTTGILKNTTATGKPSIAVAGTDYVLPSGNITGTAGNVTGIVAAANGGTGVANAVTLTLGTAAQNWATLGTGIVKNTTTTGAISDAASSDVIGLWTGTCSSTTYLNGAGACTTPSGTGTINGGAQYDLPYYSAAGTATTLSGAAVTGIPYINAAAPTAATSANVIALWTGTCSSSTYLNGAGACATPAGSGTVTSFSAPSASWPSWLVPTVATATTTPSLTVAASAIPYSAFTALAANQVLGALTATTPSGLTLPSCSTASSALTYTLGTGFGCNTISGSGTVNSGTANQFAYYSATGTAVSGNTHLTDNGTVVASTEQITAPSIALGSSPPSVTWGTGGGYAEGEGTAPSAGVPALNVDACYADSTAHAFKCSLNNGALFTSAMNLPYTGAGAAIPTGPTTSTSGDIVTYTGTAGQISDSGTLLSALVKDGVGTTTANKVAVSTGTAHTQAYIDFPMLYDVPAANCNNATAGTGWSLPTSAAPTVACRTGTNVQAGVLQFADGNSAQFNVALPGDYDSAGTVYARIRFTQGTNTTSGQTIIMQLATGCSTTTDDPAFNAAQSFGTATTTTTANTPFDETLSTVTMTGCTAGHTMNVKISRTTDTAAVAPNVYFVTLTIPRLLVNQAN